MLFVTVAETALTSGQNFLAEDVQRVAAAVLLLDADLVTWVELLVVEAQVAAEVVDGDATAALWRHGVLLGRLGAVKLRRRLQTTTTATTTATATASSHENKSCRTQSQHGK